jgi:hypothetical protein
MSRFQHIKRCASWSFLEELMAILLHTVWADWWHNGIPKLANFGDFVSSQFVFIFQSAFSSS